MTPKQAGVIGDPIGQSKSPLIHGFWLERLGIAGRYDPVHVTPGQLADFFARMRAERWRGCNVTIPHKLAVMALCDRLTPAAKAIGAVNTIFRDGKGRLVGDNTDLIGFMSALPLVAGPIACVLGSGGAARAVVKALEMLGCGPIRVVSRDEAKARALPVTVEPFGWDRLEQALKGAHLLVNTTSLGMQGQPPLQLDLAPLSLNAVVNDIVYAPLETQLLKAARARGLKVIDGLGMLIGQAAQSFEHFYGAEPDPQDDVLLRQRLMA